jgi:hypothetical protein
MRPKTSMHHRFWSAHCYFHFNDGRFPGLNWRKMMKKILLACAMAAMPMLSLAGVPTNLVVNGSFEVPVVGGWTIFDSIVGWTSTNGIEIRSNYGTAYDGQQFVELDTTQNSAMSQLLNTTAGMAYDLSFWYSPRINTGNTNDIQAFWNGVQLGSTLTGSNPDGVHHWAQYTFSVIGHGQDTLSFAAAGANDSYGGSLDAVSLSPVPEPETYAMLLAGLGLVGFIARRRTLG